MPRRARHCAYFRDITRYAMLYAIYFRHDYFSLLILPDADAAYIIFCCRIIFCHAFTPLFRRCYFALPLFRYDAVTLLLPPPLMLIFMQPLRHFRYAFAADYFFDYFHIDTLDDAMLFFSFAVSMLHASSSSSPLPLRRFSSRHTPRVCCRFHLL